MEKSDSDRQREQSIYRVTTAGSIINALLLTFKLTVGILDRSAATIADLYRAAIHERNAYRQHWDNIGKIGRVTNL